MTRALLNGSDLTSHTSIVCGVSRRRSAIQRASTAGHSGKLLCYNNNSSSSSKIKRSVDKKYRNSYRRDIYECSARHNQRASSRFKSTCSLTSIVDPAGYHPATEKDTPAASFTCQIQSVSLMLTEASVRVILRLTMDITDSPES